MAGGEATGSLTRATVPRDGRHAAGDAGGALAAAASAAGVRPQPPRQLRRGLRRSPFPRALFFDLDGTLLAPGSLLTTRTAAALRAAAGQGAQLVLATGGFSDRACRLARSLGRDLPGGTWAVSHNGGAVWSPDGRLVHQVVTPPAAMRALVEAAGPGVWCIFEALAGAGRTEVFHAGRSRADLTHFIWGPEPPAAAPDTSGRVTPAWRPLWRRARRVSPEVFEGVLGAWVLGTPQALRDLDAQAGDGRLLGARYLRWSQRLGQILARPRLAIVGRDVGPLGSSKGAAARWICERLAIAPAEVAAFGDADNDIELLDFAGTAVAMANATPNVLARADLVAPPHTADGVAQVLEDWLSLSHS
jgi:hydroxymethylpyrimidine pyrophosphatase-like HAD family hydrolase